MINLDHWFEFLHRIYRGMDLGIRPLTFRHHRHA